MQQSGLSTNVITGPNSAEGLLVGVNIVADAVKVTLGPKGRNVSIQKNHGEEPEITKDGVTVARAIRRLADREADAGAQLLKSSSMNAMKNAGDGTTTAAVLTQAIAIAGYDLVKSGVNPIDLKRQMDEACAAIVGRLKEMATPVNDNIDLLTAITTVSANGDAEMGKLVAEVSSRVGLDGYIRAEGFEGGVNSVEYIEGFEVASGFTDPLFMNDVNRVSLKNVAIMLYGRKLTSFNDIQPAFLAAKKEGKSLLIICESIEGEANATLVSKGNLAAVPSCALRLPGYGANQKTLLEDIAIITGATIISEDSGLRPSDVQLEHLGHAASVVSYRDITILQGAGGNQIKVDERVKQLKDLLEGDHIYPSEIAAIKKRLAAIMGRLAAIKIGAPTEVELREKLARLDDAMKAARAAMEEGVLPGGGSSYIRALDNISHQTPGADVLRAALEVPLKQIMFNGGAPIEEVEETISQIKSNQHMHYGFNAATWTFENLMESGVIDPLKVSRVALETAVSTAGMLLTMGASITDNF